MRSYDSLVDARHRYAHLGNYTFDFEKFDESIKIIEYILFEYKVYIEFGYEPRIQNSFMDLRNETDEIYKKIKNLDPNNKNQLKKINENTRAEITLLRSRCKLFLEEFKIYIESFEMFNEFLIAMDNISKCDLRKKSDKFEKIKVLKLCMEKL